MANILYLVHRMPYPPNKGDKVRSYHLLRHLMRDHRVFWEPSSTIRRMSLRCLRYRLFALICTSSA